MNLAPILIDSLKGSMKIILIIFTLMVAVELLVLKYQDKLNRLVSKQDLKGYTIASLLGSIPGCIGTFAADTLYMSGLMGFGGIIATMIATSGDEAFIMLSLAFTGELPWGPLLLILASLFVLGIIGGFIADKLKKRYQWTICEKCKITHHGPKEKKPRHFLREHVYQHIIKKHLWQIFLWIFAALFLIGLVGTNLNEQALFRGSELAVVLLIAALIGVLPVSGPNVFLIIMYTQGLIPFSILLTNSIVQDGHGLLPILGFSLDDALKIKLYNFLFGLIIGGTLLALGL
ncbi:arsenic efflux protein [Candidatus Woesearchaeota archaeon]|nr:arsenic efflux protein [Candidatus Woesearchaeota archaeon]